MKNFRDEPLINELTQGDIFSHRHNVSDYFCNLFITNAMCSIADTTPLMQLTVFSSSSSPELLIK